MFGIGIPELSIIVFVAAFIAFLVSRSKKSTIQKSQPSVFTVGRRIKILGWYIIIVTLMRIDDNYPIPYNLRGIIWIVLLFCIPLALSFGLLKEWNWARWGWAIFGIVNIIGLQLLEHIMNSRGQVFMPLFGDLITLGWIVSLFWLFRESANIIFRFKAVEGTGKSLIKEDVESEVENIKKENEMSKTAPRNNMKCTKCGSSDFDYDSDWKEYTCSKCGWVNKGSD